MFNANIKEWYIKEYPTDDLGQYLNDDITFSGLFETLDRYRDVYDYLGGDADSIIRERCFAKLAEIIGTDYDYVYDQWLIAARMKR
jgi:hypothetical protein